MSPRQRRVAAVAAALIIGLLAWWSLRGARRASHARQPEAIPAAAPARERVERAALAPPDRLLSPGERAMRSGTGPSREEMEGLMPHPEAVPPKDPDGPVRDWRDFTEDERAAVSGMELDMADMGDVIARLEGGAEVSALRGAEVTAEEQQALRAEIDAYAAVYETAYDSAYGNQTTVIEMAAAMRVARERFDRRVREIYGLSDAQFYEMFPYRRELGAQ
jgi:hypothetical protein